MKKKIEKWDKNAHIPVLTRAQMVSRKLKAWNPRGWTLNSHDLYSTLVAYMGEENREHAMTLHHTMINRGVRGIHTP